MWSSQWRCRFSLCDEGLPSMTFRIIPLAWFVLTSIRILSDEVFFICDVKKNSLEPILHFFDVDRLRVRRSAIRQLLDPSKRKAWEERGEDGWITMTTEATTTKTTETARTTTTPAITTTTTWSWNHRHDNSNTRRCKRRWSLGCLADHRKLNR